MARVKGLNSIGYSGRIGNTIGYEWRGRMCVRSMPSHYNDAKTERQIEVRSLFRQTVTFAGQAKQALRIGLRTSSLRAQMTECNYFMRMNRDCFALEEGELAVDYESLQFSEGPVAPVAFGAPTMLDDRTIEVAFEKNPLGRVAHSEDLVYLVAYCPEYGHFEFSNGVYRYQKKAIITINEAWVGKEIHLWGFVRDSKDRASISQYINTRPRSSTTPSNLEGERTENVKVDCQWPSTDSEAEKLPPRRQYGEAVQVSPPRRPLSESAKGLPVGSEDPVDLWTPIAKRRIKTKRRGVSHSQVHQIF